MKPYFFYFFILFFLASCQKKSPKTGNGWVSITPLVSYKTSESDFELKSGNHQYQLANEKLPMKRIVLLNASLVGYISELGAEEIIVGVSSPEYIYSNKIHQFIKENKIQNVGNEQKYDVEKIISLKPDAVFTNYIETFENTYEVIKKNGIEVIFLDEYLEQKPLDKSKYILVFGKLLGKEKEAEQKFGEIERNYQNLINLAKNGTRKPLVLANEMYGSQWYLPGGSSFVANYIKDAHANYILNENEDSKAVPMSFEEVFVKSENAQFWVNVGNHQAKKELLQVNPNYAKMKVYQNGKLYAVTGKEKDRANDFFESGVVRADWVLKDYVKIFHPELLPDYELTYMKELK